MKLNCTSIHQQKQNATAVEDVDQSSMKTSRKLLLVQVGKEDDETTRFYCFQMTSGWGWSKNIIRFPTIGVWNSDFFQGDVWASCFLRERFGKGTKNTTRNLSFFWLPWFWKKKTSPQKCQILKEDLGNLDDFRWIFSSSVLLLVKSKLPFWSLKAVLLSWLSIVFLRGRKAEKTATLGEIDQ